MTLATNPFLRLLCLLLTVYSVILLALVVTSLDDLTRPVLEPLRRIVPPIGAGGVGIDLSVAIAFVILWVLRNVVCS